MLDTTILDYFPSLLAFDAKNEIPSSASAIVAPLGNWNFPVDPPLQNLVSKFPNLLYEIFVRDVTRIKHFSIRLKNFLTDFGRHRSLPLSTIPNKIRLPKESHLTILYMRHPTTNISSLHGVPTGPTLVYRGGSSRTVFGDFSPFHGRATILHHEI